MDRQSRAGGELCVWIPRKAHGFQSVGIRPAFRQAPQTTGDWYRLGSIGAIAGAKSSFSPTHRSEADAPQLKLYQYRRRHNALIPRTYPKIPVAPASSRCMTGFGIGSIMPSHMTDRALTITVLGSGTSHGVPMIACDCPVCTSSDPHDKRTRPSITIRYGKTTLLIDTGPELRLQCLANNVTRVDAVLYTHYHVDHIAGLDDLRRFNWLQKKAIPCHGQPATLDRLRAMFPYVFDNEFKHPSAVPRLELLAITGPFDIGGRTITPIPLLHGDLPVLGFRVGNFAYCTDVSRIPPDSWPLLSGLDALILDGLRRRPHPTHFNLDQAVEHAHKIGANKTYFTHIAHELGHEETNKGLPDGMALAYDTQIIRSS